jgi:hypothetical protein
MTVLRQRMIEDMQLRGLAARTQEAYVVAVEQLAKYPRKSPDDICEEELRQYLLYLQNEKGVSASTMTVALCGIKFLYQHTLQREWHLLDLACASVQARLWGGFRLDPPFAVIGDASTMLRLTSATARSMNPLFHYGKIKRNRVIYIRPSGTYICKRRAVTRRHQGGG